MESHEKFQSVPVTTKQQSLLPTVSIPVDPAVPSGSTTGVFFCCTLWLWLTVRHGIDGPNRNRWFTELKNGDFEMAMLHNQMVPSQTVAMGP